MIVSIANQKGGVGKTTTAITLAAALAGPFNQTLILDTDPQGHVAVGLGLPKSCGLQRLITQQMPVAALTQPARPNLSIIASDKATEATKRYMVTMDYRERALVTALENAPYQTTIIDMAPSFDVLHVAGLIASHWVVIPTRLDHLALDGVNEVLRSIAEINRNGGQIAGYSILPTFFDRVTNETHTQLSALVQAHGQNVLPPIPADVRAREAAAYGQTLWEYAPKCPALTGYRNGAGQVGGYMQVVSRLRRLWGMI